MKKIADRIKGITVEIGGDTTDLNSALADVNERSRNLSRELGDVQRLLRLDPTNTELVAQQQHLLAEQVENTTERLNRLRSVSQQVERQFADGLISPEQFRAFQREVQATEGRLERLGRQGVESADDMKQAFKDAANEMGGALAGALAGGVGAAGIVEKALEVTSFDTTIELSFNVPEESKQSVKDAVSAVTAYGIDAETALNGVRKQWQLNASLTDAENEKIVQGAAAISRAYSDIDFNELIQETQEMALGMEMTHDEALGMTKALLDMGFPPDQLDIITEYGQQLTRAGYDASEIQNIFAAGIETGTWNIDVLLDGLKEGRIVAAEFGQGIDDATKAAIEGTDISAKQLQAWGKAAAAGGDAGKTAMGEMANAVLGIEDATKRNEVGIKFFGTLWEENGEMIAESLAAANTGTADLKANQDNLNASIDAMNADPQVRLNQALSELSTQLKPLLATIAEWTAKVADWIAKNPELAAGITVVVTGIGLLIAACMALTPAFMLLSAGATALGIGLLPLTGIILGIILIIGLLVAAFIYWRKNSDEIIAAAQRLKEKVLKAFTEWKEGVKQRFNDSVNDIKRLWNSVMEFFKGINLKQIGRDIIQGLVNGIAEMKDKVLDKAREIADGITKKIKGALKLGSPSKVLIGIGEDTGEGLAIGLQNSMSSINAMSEKMAAAATPNIDTKSRAAAATNGNSLIVNLNSPKALDVRDAAKEFNRSINKMSLLW